MCVTEPKRTEKLNVWTLSKEKKTTGNPCCFIALGIDRIGGQFMAVKQTVIPVHFLKNPLFRCHYEKYIVYANYLPHA